MSDTDQPNIDEIRMLTGKHCDDIQDIIDAAKTIPCKRVEIVAVSLVQMVLWLVLVKSIFRTIVRELMPCRRMR